MIRVPHPQKKVTNSRADPHKIHNTHTQESNIILLAATKMTQNATKIKIFRRGKADCHASCDGTGYLD